MTSEANFSPHTVVSDQLQYGEKVLRVGKTLPNRDAEGCAPQGIFMAGIWLFLYFLATYAPNAMLRNKPIGPIAPVMLVFFVVTVVLTLLMFRAAKTLRQAAFGITNKRVVLVEQLARGELKVSAYNYPLYMERRNLPDGKGDLIFTNTVRQKLHNGRKEIILPAGLFGIDDVAEVERLILEVLPGSTSTTGHVRNRLRDE
jgi:hypothetical protein